MEAQDLAFDDQDESGLATLIERILAPYTANPEAVAIGLSPDVELGPRMIMSLSLILHELATNAAKYGSLSVPAGRVQVSWQLEEENSQLRLRWVESGGPPVTPPTKAGYGTELIQSATTYNLGGQVELKYPPSGLGPEIVIPLGSAPLPGVKDDHVQKTVLIVEDEFLIAMDLKLMLEDRGWRVIGPVATVLGALRLLEDELPSVALLDVNLGNELVTAVAEALKARDVPFAIASAYGHPEQIGGEALAGAPNVGKPTGERRLLAALAELIGS